MNAVSWKIISCGPFGTIYCAPAETGFRFIKPLESKLMEEKGSDHFYYTAFMENHVKKLANLGGSKPFYGKKEIDLLPRHLRRGGEYGHDAVIVQSRDQTLQERKYAAKKNKHNSFVALDKQIRNDRIDHLIKLCKTKGIQLVYK